MSNNSKIDDIKNFLSNFYQRNNKKPSMVIVNSDPSVRNSSMNFVTIEEALELNNAGHDVYHYINGGPKNLDVKKLNSFYIDIDAGRSEDGSYLPLKDVRIKKHTMLKTLKDFPFEPTFIVETRNGFQIYWCLKTLYDNYRSNLILWKGVQARLVTFFYKCGADKRTIKEAQLYRVPYTFWNKTYEGIKPYECKILYSSDNKYNLFDFSEKLSRELKITPYTRIREIISSGVSYTNPAKISTNSLTTNTNDVKSSLLQEISAFLDQVTRPLALTNNGFLSTSAKRLSTEIVNTFGLE